MNDFSGEIKTFLEMLQTTKNLSAKTIIAYNSDLQDFLNYTHEKDLNDDTVLKYVQGLF